MPSAALRACVMFAFSVPRESLNPLGEWLKSLSAWHDDEPLSYRVVPHLFIPKGGGATRRRRRRRVRLLLQAVGLLELGECKYAN